MTSNNADATGASNHPIIGMVAEKFGIAKSRIFLRDAHYKVVVPRQIAMYLLATLVGWKPYRIAGLFCRNNATVLNAIKKIAAQLQKDKDLAVMVSDIATRYDLEFNHRRAAVPINAHPGSHWLYPHGERGWLILVPSLPNSGSMCFKDTEALIAFAEGIFSAHKKGLLT